MNIKKIGDLTEREFATLSFKSNLFEHEGVKYQAEAIAYHEQQKHENGYVPQSTFAIYVVAEGKLQEAIHKEFFEIELTSDQLKEAVQNGEKNIKQYLRNRNVKIAG